MKPCSVFLLCAAVMIATTSCSGNSSHNDTRPKTVVKEVVHPFVALCDNINYADTAALHDEEVMKRTMVKVVKELLVTDSMTARRGLALLFDGLRRDEKALVSATGFADDYLNSPASPVRDAGVYIDFLNTLLDVDSLPAVVRDVAAERLRVASLNRPGSQANDFRFEERDGARRSLYDVKSPVTLIVFYDPECVHCTDILNAIAANRAVNAAIDEGRLTVVAIYAEGKRDVWRKNLGDMPANWTVGYDLSGILDNELYDLPAMPTLYLLDADKRVLLKDPEHSRLGKIFAR